MEDTGDTRGATETLKKMAFGTVSQALLCPHLIKLTTWLLALSTGQVETMTGLVPVSTARAQGGASEQHLPLKRKLSARGSVLGLESPGQDGALSLAD